MSNPTVVKTTLSHDQIEALDDISKLFNSTHREQVLTGSPGAGKSFLTSQIIAKAEATGYQLVLAATTHQASKVLADFTGRHVSTIHKLLDLKVKNDYVNNTTSLHRIVARDGPVIEKFMNAYKPALLLIDEASYIDEEIDSYVQETLEDYPKLVILYIGDADQLPPVGSEVPHVFTTNKPTSILTTDHRYPSDSQMASIVKTLKKNIQDKSYFLCNIADGKDITVVNEAGFMAKLDELYQSQEYAYNPYHVKSMAYRNVVVNNINEHIRKMFWNDPMYQPGERLIMNAPLVRKKKVLANNGDIVTVTSNRPDTINGVPGQRLTLLTETGDEIWGLSITDKEFRQKNLERKRLVRAQKWGPLYNFMESFVEVKDMYASTIHKAQGASYTNVMLHLEDLVGCQDHTLLARLLLVAVSRASKHVYVYGEVPSNLMRAK